KQAFAEYDCQAFPVSRNLRSNLRSSDRVFCVPCRGAASPLRCLSGNSLSILYSSFQKCCVGSTSMDRTWKRDKQTVSRRWHPRCYLSAASAHFSCCRCCRRHCLHPLVGASLDYAVSRASFRRGVVEYGSPRRVGAG